MRRREFARSLAASGISMMIAGRGAATSAAEIPVPPKPRPGFDWMERMEIGRHHLVHGIDASGIPYFDVLMQRPYAEASHSFPDLVDLTGRYWEGTMIVHDVTGRPVETEPLLQKRALALFSEPDGLTYNPPTRFSYHRTDITGFTRILCALVRRAELEPSAENRRALLAAIRAVKKIIPTEGDIAWIPSQVWHGGTWEAPMPPPSGDGFATILMLRPLTEASAVLNDQEPLELAVKLVKGLRAGGEYDEEGRFTGHVHAHLDGIAGIVDCGLLTGDRSMVEWGSRAFDYIRRFSTEFGWIPENLDRVDDCTGCETCAIMDYADAAVLLARAGRHDLWDLIERVTRNHLVESQIVDPTWLAEPPNARDSDITIQRQVGRRMVGASAGWSSPIGILAYDESYWKGSWNRYGPGPWDHIESGRIRAIQNCCGPSGIKGLYRVWRATARVEAKTLVVEMPFDRALADASVVARQPFGQGLSVAVRTPLKVRVRIPQHPKPLPPEEHIPGATAPTLEAGSGQPLFAARRNGQSVTLSAAGGYLTLDELKPGEKLEIDFHRPQRTERVSIGNPGYQSYGFRVHWRGATVVKMQASDKNPARGYNKIMKHETAIYMKGDVEHPLYQRKDWT